MMNVSLQDKSKTIKEIEIKLKFSDERFFRSRLKSLEEHTELVEKVTNLFKGVLESIGKDHFRKLDINHL